MNLLLVLTVLPLDCRSHPRRGDGWSASGWRLAGRGTFHVIDGALQSVPSFDLGFLVCTVPIPQNYQLELAVLIRHMTPTAAFSSASASPTRPACSTRFFPFPSNGKYMFSVHTQRVDCSLVSAGSNSFIGLTRGPRPKTT